MGEAESQQFWQGRHFCKGKRDWFERIQFLKVAFDCSAILRVNLSCFAVVLSLHRAGGNGIFSGIDSLEDRLKYKSLKLC